MGVFAAEGRFGSGKTAYCVWFARQLAERRGGVPIWANFSIVGASPLPGLRRPVEEDGLRLIDDLYRCENGVIVLDELQGTIHARRSNHNLEFLNWFDQCRKQDSDVICITQAFHKIDVIVREMIEVGFSCENKGPRFSRITPVDMESGRQRSPFQFDRSVSYSFYDHKQRAWALKGEEKAAKELSVVRPVARRGGF